MLSFLIRKTLWGILTVGGVMILTFVLFRVAAGDPASTLAGKNPRPEELESLRAALGSDKPLFYGGLRRTELYTNCDFSGSKSVFVSLETRGKVQPEADGMHLASGSALVFKRNFAQPENARAVLLKIESETPLSVNGTTYAPERGTLECRFTSAPDEIIVTPHDSNGAVVVKAGFFKETGTGFDTQLADSFSELVSFDGEFPYISFFNFGKTLQTREEIRPKLWRGMCVSLSLMIPVFLGELVLGIAFAMISSAARGSLADRVIMTLSIASMSISYLALIIFGQWIFAYYLNIFPVWGYGGVMYLVLPAAIGIASGTGGGVRFYRSVFLNEMNREYLRTALAKGVPAYKIYFRHLLSNALVPIITRASTVLPFLFTGSLLLESFFGIPGLGYEGVNALNDSDLQMLKAIVLLSALMFVVMNFITDLVCAWADPRIRIR